MARTETGHEMPEALIHAPAERVAGYEARDPQGRKVGSVERPFPNRDGEPEYVMTKMGLLGLKSVLLPVQMVEECRTLVLQ